MEKLIIIDSNALMHRAYHALPPLKTPKGQLVNAVYGFATILFKVINQLKPGYVTAVFDLKGPTFRQEQYRDYKAKRIKPPQEFYDQIPLVEEMLNLLGVPIYSQHGYEADDIIGAIVYQNERNYSNMKNIVITGDLDILQLVSRQTQVYLLKTGISQGIIYGVKEIRSRFGFNPKQIVDYKALRGDASDNIPGVPGVGEKTALMLIEKFGDLKKLYKELELSDLNPKLKSRLLEYKEQAFLSYDLAEIKKEFKMDFNLSKAKWGNYNQDKLIQFFNKLEFNSLIKRVPVL